MRDPGGGGINVTRAIRLLGGEARAFAAVGGQMGQIFQNLITREGVQLHAYQIDGETRQSMAVIDDKTGKQYRFVMPGAHWGAGQVKQALSEIASNMPKRGFVVLSGSNPPGVPDTFPALLVRTAIPFDTNVIVDTSGKALRRLANTPTDAPYVLRMDKAEAEELAGARLETVSELSNFAATLITRNVAKKIVLALGPIGSVMATENQCWHAKAADVPVRSKVGAGDSFVAAMTLAMANGDTDEIALQKGVAAASAAVTTDATRLCPRAIAEDLIKDCPLTRLA